MVRYDRDSSASDTASRTTPKPKDRTAANARHDRQNKRYDPEATDYRDKIADHLTSAWMVNKTHYKYTAPAIPAKIKTPKRKEATHGTL